MGPLSRALTALSGIRSDRRTGRQLKDRTEHSRPSLCIRPSRSPFTDSGRTCMRCIECLFENPTGAQRCKGCGASLQNDKGLDASDHLAIEATHERRGFFSFGTLISPTFIQVIYVMGAAVISLGGVLMIVLVLTGVAPKYTEANRDALLIGGLTLLGVGNILWRVLCEMVMLLFRIHEVLVNLDDKARALIALLAGRK